MHYSSILFLVLGTLALTNGQLTAISASEGSCNGPRPSSRTDREVWDLMFKRTGSWHVPMASEFFYRRQAEVLRGYPAVNETALSQMHLKLKCTLLSCSISGYGKRLNFVCYPSSFSIDNSALVTEYTCPATFGSTAADWREFAGLSSQGHSHGHSSNQNGRPPRVSILWNDGSDTIVAKYCFDGDYRAFAVYSKSATLDQNKQRRINSTLINAGFESSHFQYL